MEYKDYYRTLGVDKKASEKEIKSAYRKLARKYHPDVNPGDKAAESKFKEINEAQAVLTDPEKRKKYDTLGPDWERRFQQYRPGAGRPATTTSSGGSEGVGDFSDFFETLFGQRGSQSGGGFDFDLGSIFGRGRQRVRPQPQRGADLDQSVELSLADAFRGVEQAYTVQSAQTCPTCHGTGLVDDAPCATCAGTGSIPKTKRLEVKIPAGVREGSRIRVAGEGNPGMLGGPNGDLFLVVHVQPDTRFRREGDDLFTDISAPFTSLVLGGEVEVPTLKGRISMNIPAGSQNGRTLRLAGQGMPQLRTDRRGDLYVKLNATLPTTLNDQQRTLFQQLARAGV